MDLVKSLRVPYTDFKAQYQSSAAELNQAVQDVLSRGDFILGRDVQEFEQKFAALCQTKHAIGVGSGTDGIILVLKALGIKEGDEVITTANTFIATAAAVAWIGAKPVFADVGPDMLMNPDHVQKLISEKTKAIMPVHLAGQICQMDKITDIAKKNQIAVIEDAAQSAGSLFNNKPSGSFGLAGVFSLHPLKNLNAAGDAGIVTTSDDKLAEQLRLFRNHGLVNRDEVHFWGTNSRLDNLQAAILLVRMKKLKDVISKRRALAERYRAGLASIVQTPIENPGCFHTYHLFVIQTDKRDQLKQFLTDRGVETKIHYPIPIHLQKAASALESRKGDLPETEKQATQILSLPIHQNLSDDQVDYVISSIKEFFKK